MRSMRSPSIRSTVRVARFSPGSSGSVRVGYGDLDPVPGHGDLAELAHHQPADRVVVLVIGQLDAGGVLDLVGAEQPGEAPAAVAPLTGAGAEPVVLVGDVADDLLDDVLERDDTGVAAVLVEHDRHLEAVTTQQGQQRVEPQAVGDHGRLDHDVPDPRGRALVERQRDRVLDVDGADDGVLCVEHREPGQAGLPGQLDDGGGAVGLVDGRGAHPRGHDLPCGAGAELDAALHQLGGLGVQGALVGGTLDQGGELLGAARRAELLLGLDAEAAYERVGGAVEHPDRPLVQGREAAHEALGVASGLQRHGQGDVLRHHLAEQHREHGAERQADAERDRRAPSRRAPRGPRAASSTSWAIAGSARKPTARLVIVMPDLRARELGRERPQRPLHALGSGVTGRGCAIDAAAVDGDEGELGCHEEPADGDQRQRGEQEQPRGHDAAPQA